MPVEALSPISAPLMLVEPVVRFKKEPSAMVTVAVTSAWTSEVRSSAAMGQTVRETVVFIDSSNFWERLRYNNVWGRYTFVYRTLSSVFGSFADASRAGKRRGDADRRAGGDGGRDDARSAQLLRRSAQAERRIDHGAMSGAPHVGKISGVPLAGFARPGNAGAGYDAGREGAEVFGQRRAR